MSATFVINTSLSPISRLQQHIKNWNSTLKIGTSSVMKAGCRYSRSMSLFQQASVVLAMKEFKTENETNGNLLPFIQG